MSGALTGCSRVPDSEREEKSARATTKTKTPDAVVMVDAPETGDVAQVVQKELLRASESQRQVLVYVGAKWCEPCRHFHEAAARHELDAAFPKLTLVAFDLDRDRTRLAAAGYASDLIPLFAVPGADGRSSERRITGSIKGDGAVGEIAPRLRALLNGT